MGEKDPFDMSGWPSNHEHQYGKVTNGTPTT